MADDARQNTSDTDSVAASYASRGRQYQWMTNILAPARTRGMYVKPLEHVTRDARVPFFRLVISIGGIGAILIGGLKLLSDNHYRAGYIWVPTLIIMISLAIMLVVFMVSSRGESMLLSALSLNFFKINEDRRRKSNLHLSSLGIESFDEFGHLHFTNGDVGSVWSVRGQLSSSTIPAVADGMAGARERYFIARRPVTQEMRITSVEPNMFAVQRSAMGDLAEQYEGTENPQDKWRSVMCRMQQRYLVNLAKSNSQMTMVQTVVLRDPNIDELTQHERYFQSIADGGVYDRSHQIFDADEVVARLGGLALMSTVIAEQQPRTAQAQPETKTKTKTKTQTKTQTKKRRKPKNGFQHREKA